MSLKLKRHYKLIVMLLLVSAVLVLGFGDRPVVSYTVDDSSIWTGATTAEVAQAATLSASSVTLPGDTIVNTTPILAYDAY